MPIPIIIPMPATNTIPQGSSSPKFIETYEDKMINISMAVECGTYKSGGQYWIWFRIPGQSSSYYAYPFQTEEEAKKKLNEILKE